MQNQMNNQRNFDNRRDTERFSRRNASNGSQRGNYRQDQYRNGRDEDYRSEQNYPRERYYDDNRSNSGRSDFSGRFERRGNEWDRGNNNQDFERDAGRRQSQNRDNRRIDEKLDDAAYQAWLEENQEMHEQRRKNFEHFMGLCKIRDMERNVGVYESDSGSDFDEEEYERYLEEGNKSYREEKKRREEFAGPKLQEPRSVPYYGGRHRRSQIEVPKSTIPPWVLRRNLKNEMRKWPSSSQAKEELNEEEAEAQAEALSSWVGEIRDELEQVIPRPVTQGLLYIRRRAF